ncbi:hypothetical protein [Mucilaginibacter sp. L3T2-6]|uniref:hypothetical protein n=1 Tax=Mucilaginibacter sp. L3T2-6 TaxID=3062491 RepID=UPI002676D473|nr:hypothetical protein [Mucilaginibacter sp. L3T2-6]MDO3643061.1 hypothetical protein [Mucilaginibacter sp. L3T2-6]MDV6215828.1 hypothetical protein [Mucilaginibacter sp. L3T2-6]
MKYMKPLNLFYQEPDPDRWVKFDRYPRHLIRRIVRGKPKPGGVMMVALNLIEGLKKIGVPYRFNDYTYIRKHTDEIACVIGKPHLLTEQKWRNPIIFGAGVFSHPIEAPDLLIKHPLIKKILVPGRWMQTMFEAYYGDKVVAWPTGVDTGYWQPFDRGNKRYDFLIYDKVRWEHENYQKALIGPIESVLKQHNLSHQMIRYGSYTHNELMDKLSQSRAAIFLCEHETQGLAYQQILSTNTPILAWDRGGYWQDPYYYPHKVQFGPVSSVPYWDERCGAKFKSIDDFEENLQSFLEKLGSFRPRDYILENLTLEICARKYIDIHQQVEKELT